MRRNSWIMSFLPIMGTGSGQLVQDAMLKLVRRYSNKPASEWRPLFYRILHNGIMDWHRHQKVPSSLFITQKQVFGFDRRQRRHQAFYIRNCIHGRVIVALILNLVVRQ